jgi:transcriptional regulator with GAF, ATPase, and Fis domain
LEKPIQPAVLLALIERAAAQTRLIEETELLNRQLSFHGVLGDLVGGSRAMRQVFSEIQQVAPTSASVLITGESGTGKELVARALHRLSPRSGAPFIPINCAAITETLMESELFGHEKGAFTGAVAPKIGRFEMADGGTIFLDEIGDLPLAIQPKLLRVLQEQEFERLGSGRTRRVNVRLVAATHRNLAQMVGRNEFRSDLYYRLNVFPVLVPPLRNRTEDIPQLLSHFVEHFGGRMGKTIDHIPQEVVDAFTSYSWPGNVRELQNLVERAVIRSNDGVLPNPLPAATSPVMPDNGQAVVTPSDGIFADSQRALILRTLRATGWVIGGLSGAAARLGLKRTTLIAKMKKLGISRPVRQPELDTLGQENEVQELWHPSAR